MRDSAQQGEQGGNKNPETYMLRNKKHWHGGGREREQGHAEGGSGQGMQKRREGGGGRNELGRSSSGCKMASCFNTNQGHCHSGLKK